MRLHFGKKAMRRFLFCALALMSVGVFGQKEFASLIPSVSDTLLSSASFFQTDARAAGKLTLPVCQAGQVLSSNGSVLVCKTAVQIWLPNAHGENPISSDGTSLSVAEKSPTGVIFFSSDSSCPEGWSAFSSAAGKYLAAAGSGKNGVGGSDAVSLSVVNIPAHTHGGAVTLTNSTFQASTITGGSPIRSVTPIEGYYISTGYLGVSTTYGPFMYNLAVPTAPANLNAGQIKGNMETPSTGNGSSFSVEPGYFALTPCVKD